MLTHWKLRVSVGIKNLLSFFLFTCKTSSPPFESFIPFPFVSRWSHNCTCEYIFWSNKGRLSKPDNRHFSLHFESPDVLFNDCFVSCVEKKLRIMVLNFYLLEFFEIETQGNKGQTILQEQLHRSISCRIPSVWGNKTASWNQKCWKICVRTRNFQVRFLS